VGEETAFFSFLCPENNSLPPSDFFPSTRQSLYEGNEDRFSPMTGKFPFPLSEEVFPPFLFPPLPAGSFLPWKFETNVFFPGGRR